MSVEMVFAGVQNIPDHNIGSTGTDDAFTLGIIQGRQNAGILIEQGDVQSGILFELIQKRIVPGDIRLSFIQKISNISLQVIIAGIGSVSKGSSPMICRVYDILPPLFLGVFCVFSIEFPAPSGKIGTHISINIII